MRIIGEVAHPRYKISVLQMNEKTTVQIEDRLVSQSYTFRDGSGINTLASVEELLTPDFLQKVDARFVEMNKDYMEALERLNNEEVDSFEII